MTQQEQDHKMTIDKTKNPPPSDIPSQETKTSTNNPTLRIDVDYFQSFLDDSTIPETQKRQYIEDIWSIVVSFVDLGFGVHPLQQARDNGQSQQNNALSGLIEEINWEDTEKIDEVIKTETNLERKGI